MSEIKYKHRVVQSPPPEEHVLTPAEMGTPFHALMQETTDSKNIELEKSGKKPVDMDAMPFFRMQGPFAKTKESHGFSFFNMIPHDMVRRTKRKVKDKNGKEVEIELFEKEPK